MRSAYDANGQSVWVHPDNLLEVKIRILRQLPVLVYNPQSSKVVEGMNSDPTITSLYFDNSKFSLYGQKVDRAPDASSLRLRWYGQLSQQPDITFEKKSIKDDDKSEEKKFPIKEKYVQSFIKGEYQMEKTSQKMRERHIQTVETIEHFEETVEDIQAFIKEYDLQPLLRANYTRTAFQIPGDDRVRISLDTNLALIREDALDTEHPCRNPQDWHRSDIDNADMEYPFTSIPKAEIVRFPFAQLEIKLRETSRQGANAWVSDLMNSHLVKEAPRFSKFVHGTAQLFEDYVNSFPFWLSELDSDIRKDPEIAFVEEQDKKAKRAEDEVAVGSFVGGSRSSAGFKSPGGGSPGRDKAGAKVKKMSGQQSRTSSSPLAKMKRTSDRGRDGGEERGTEGETDSSKRHPQPSRGLGKLLPSFASSISTSKYARAHRQTPLPPGVHAPTYLLNYSTSTPVNVEPKVWLANQRTFIKWQHICILLTSLSLGLFNAAGRDNDVARGLAVAYTCLAVFAGGWGWWTYVRRGEMIKARGVGGENEFSRVLGPMVICLGLIVALCLNFALQVTYIFPSGQIMRGVLKGLTLVTATVPHGATGEISNERCFGRRCTGVEYHGSCTQSGHGHE